MGYLTVRLPFDANGDVVKELLSTVWLFKMATHRVLSLARQQQVLPGTRIGWKNTFRDIAYGVIPNRRYADGAIILVMGIYESCRSLGVDFRGVELADWLMFQQSELEYPNRNITLKPNYVFHVTTVRFDGSIGRVVLKPTISKTYKELLDAILTERIKYVGKVLIDGVGARGSQLWLHGEVQVTIPSRCLLRTHG